MPGDRRSSGLHAGPASILGSRPGPGGGVSGAQLRGPGSPAPPAPPTDLERRLLAAWRASGLPLGKLVVRAADAYALGAAVSLTGIVDEALVAMCERWVREHAGRAGR